MTHCERKPFTRNQAELQHTNQTINQPTNQSSAAWRELPDSALAAASDESTRTAAQSSPQPQHCASSSILSSCPLCLRSSLTCALPLVPLTRRCSNPRAAPADKACGAHNWNSSARNDSCVVVPSRSCGGLWTARALLLPSVRPSVLCSRPVLRPPSVLAR